MSPKKVCRDRCLVPERRRTAALNNKPQLRALRQLREQIDLRLAACRKNAVAFKRPNGLPKSALMHQAVKDGRKDDEPAIIDLSQVPEALFLRPMRAADRSRYWTTFS